MDLILEKTLLYANVDIPVIAVKKTTYKLGLLEIKLKPGIKTQVPYRVLKVLEERGEVQPDPDEVMSLSALSKIQWKEEKTSEIIPLDEGFYLKAKIFFQILRKRIKEGDERAEILFRKAKILLSDIVRRRISKIVSLAIANPSPSRELINKMTLEERIFYTKICYEINNWTSGIANFVLGDKQ